VSGKPGMVRKGPYSPAPDSMAWRALEVLSLAPNGHATTRELATALGLDPKGIGGYFKGAVRNDWLRFERISENPADGYMWSRGDSAPPPPEVPDPPEDTWPIRRFVNAHEAPMLHKLGPASIFDLALEV
jgi:hypothetical protein